MAVIIKYQPPGLLYPGVFNAHIHVLYHKHNPCHGAPLRINDSLTIPSRREQKTTIIPPWQKKLMIQPFIT